MKIWRDNWIPREHNLKVIGRRTRSRLKWVSDLFLPDRQQWNEELVRNIFYPPGCRGNPPDTTPAQPWGWYCGLALWQNGHFHCQKCLQASLEAELCSENSGEWRKKFMEEYLECPSPAESSCLRVEASTGLSGQYNQRNNAGTLSAPRCVRFAGTAKKIDSTRRWPALKR